MNFWKRIFFLGIGLLYFSTTTVAQAQGTSNETYTLLPTLDAQKFPTEKACILFLEDFNDIYFFSTDPAVREQLPATLQVLGQQVSGADYFTTTDLLACAIKTGRIKFAYVPYFLKYFLRLGTIAAGIVSLLFIVIGAYKYTFSGLTDDKDGAKKTILYAIAGLIVSSLAWIIVQLVQSFVTGGF